MSLLQGAWAASSCCTMESCSSRVMTLSLDGTIGALPGAADASASITDDHAVIALSLGSGALLA